MKTLYQNGTILPMDQERTAEALLVEDSRITACGSCSEVAPLADGADLVDLHGAALMPAFIDGHSHITALAQTMGLVQLNGAESLRDIGERVAAFRRNAALRAQDWIIGFGYDQNFLDEKRHPTAAELDLICPDRPFMMGHASGHMGVLNSLALQALHITADTADPEGGRIGRIPGSNQPNGYLEETAFTTLGSRIPSDPESALTNLQKAEDIYLSNGIATIHDGLTKTPEWQLLRAASEQGRLRADIVSYIDIRDHADLIARNPAYHKQYKNRLKIGGYKLFLDGSPQGRTAWVTEPYLNGEKGYCGYPIYSDAEVLRFLDRAQREDEPIHVHCNGDAAAAQFLACYEKAYREYKNEIRPVMIHAQLLRPDQLPALKRLHMIASFFTAHTYYWGDIHVKNFGPARAEQISPAKSALEHGVLFDFHQDTPVISPNMLETVWCAVNRITREGRQLGKAECISTFQALKAVTANAAFAIFEEQEKGTLTPGKRADLVVLDQNPLSCPPKELRSLRVLATIKDGTAVYRQK